MGRPEERKGSSIKIQGARVPVYQEVIVHYDSSWWKGKSEEFALVFVDSMMNWKQRLTSRLDILSRTSKDWPRNNETSCWSSWINSVGPSLYPRNLSSTFSRLIQPICSVRIKTTILHPGKREPESMKRDSVWSCIVSGTTASTILLQI